MSRSEFPSGAMARMTLGCCSALCCLLLLILTLSEQCAGEFNPLFKFESRGKPVKEVKLLDNEESVSFRPTNPIVVYGKSVDEISVYRNGWVKFGSQSTHTPSSTYPNGTLQTNQRLQDFDGLYLAVFTSVNDQNRGSVIIREIDPAEQTSIDCFTTKQIDRIQQLIKLRNPDGPGFSVKSLVAITWENMTNAQDAAGKSNAYTLILLTNLTASYAITQYRKVEWPERDRFIANSLPPEAGVFVKPNDGFQLPRSGHSVNTSLWESESNVALPGEWLIPLHETSVDTTSTIDQLLSISDRFVNELRLSCPAEFRRVMREVSSNFSRPIDLLNDSPAMSTEVVDIDPYSYIDEADEDFGYDTDPAGQTDSFWASYEEALGNRNNEQTHPSSPGTEPSNHETPSQSGNEPTVVSETVVPLGIYDGDESRFYTVEPTIMPKTVIPLEETESPDDAYYRNYGRSQEYGTERMSEPRAASAVRCDATSQCSAPESECYTVQGKSCCACKQGYYGFGNKRCWSEDSDCSFSFRGTLNASFGVESFQLPVYLDIQNGRSKRSSSGVRNGFATDPNFQILRLLTPMFHVFNALIATSCITDLTGEQPRVTNLFTLAGGFQSSFNVQFYFDLDHIGKLTASVTLKLDEYSQESYARGSLDVELAAPEGIGQIQRIYREATNVAEPSGKTYYAIYHLDQHSRVVFPEQSVKFVAEPRGLHEAEAALDELTVRWSAIAMVSPSYDQDRQSDCLMKPGGPISLNQMHYVKMLDRGYCSEDCSSPDNTCNLFCIDIPLLSATEPDACSCVKCPGQREYCKPHGPSYTCECQPGLRRMEDHTCRDDARSAANPKPREACGPVYCHENGRCIDPQQGLCQCFPGYRGDGVNNCEDDPCARCQRNEICENDQCKPTGVDLCEGIRCGKQAFCRDGACVCTPGYTGDPMVECIEERELCAGVQCHRFAQCYENRCYCSHGYVGDGLNFCDVHTEDPCDGVRCAENGECRDGRCTCISGYEGDGYRECRPMEDKCANVLCHAYAQCQEGQCRCLDGYEGDGYRECRPMGRCTEQECHPNAHCVSDRCQCRAGYEGDGYTNCQRRPSVDPNKCGKCRGIPHKELAQCIDGQCICASGFIMASPGVCIECVQANCHQHASCLPNAQYNGAFSCQCKAGFQGDGVTSCVQVGTEIDATCGGGCRVRNAECNPLTGRCECRRGFEGDGNYQCSWNCQQCVRDAVCDQQNERCTCKPGYRGDGTLFCEPIPVRPEPVKVHISGQGDVLRVADLDKPLLLRCLVSTTDETITGQWIQPKGSQTAHISINRLADGTENLLRITKPALTDAGRYYCRAGSAEAFIDVVIEETAVPYDIFLTSDDGILKVKSSGKNTTMATIWSLAENNKYGRIAMVTDCNQQRVIYTSDYGHAIRWGDAQAKQKELVTSIVYESQVNRFRNLVVDPPSGNVFAWDEAFGRLVVLNPTKPHMKYTLDSIGSFKQAEPLRFAGLALHSTNGLIYWAAFTDGWMPNGTIQVASMTGQRERQLLQLSGEPLAISLSPSFDNTDNSAGRLCWIQRSLTNVYALTTEMHCARLSADGLSVVTQERLRQFSPSEEPSWGMVHHRGTVLWTDASKPVFYSANPARRVHVRHVCCSNRFQAISVLAKCDPALSNSCAYSNGRCRYFCLPDIGQGSRVCVCPDSEVGCHKEM